MSTVAFALIAVMLGIYVLLDGYDLGIAAITPLVARSAKEREASMRAIGPFWNGNEVWLIAAGGTLFALFPKAYASAFSGFYLPFIIVLWLLMFRGIAMELRAQLTSAIWRDFWDFCFSASSALLAIVFGVALGNLVRGLPLDASGYFNGTFGFLLNPFALLTGILALCALGLHGAIFLTLRVEGAPAERARLLIGRLAPTTLVLCILTTIFTISTLGARGPTWWAVFPVGEFAGLAIAWFAARRHNARAAFAGSSLLLVSLLAAAGAAMYPYLLPGFPMRASGLSVTSVSPSPVAVVSALSVVIVGLCAVVIYGTIVARALRGKLKV